MNDGKKGVRGLDYRLKVFKNHLPSSLSLRIFSNSTTSI